MNAITAQPSIDDLPPTVSARENEAVSRPQCRQRKLLVVEDEVLVAMQMAMLMENLGWSIVGPASSLKEADQLLADEEEIDFAILDVNLRGESVFPIAETLHQRGVPILFHTGYDSLVEADRFEGCGTIFKPAPVNLIVSRIRLMMEHANSACA